MISRVDVDQVGWSIMPAEGGGTDAVLAMLSRAASNVPFSGRSTAVGLHPLYPPADWAQRYLAAGLLNELELHVVPVLLGDGARLFETSGTRRCGLRRSGLSRRPASRTSSTER